MAISYQRKLGDGTIVIDSGTSNVGIGTNDPDLKLHIAHSDGNNGLLLEHSDQASGFQVLQNIRETEGLIWQRWSSGSFSSNLMTLTYSGELGIGTTSPDQKLQIHDSSSTGVYLHVTNSTTGEDGGNGALFGISSNEEALVWNYENTATRFSTNGTERMRISSDGNVGIGTSSPTPKLHLVYSGGTYSADATSGFINQADTGRATMRLRSITDNPSELFFDIDGGIRWDISARGSSQDHSLNFYPAAATPGYTSVSAHTFQLSQNGDVIVTGSGSSGKMGIGTTSPTFKLHVAGDILLEDAGTPIFRIKDSGNAGGGGAAGIIQFSNTDGNSIGIGYTGDDTTTSDLIISTNAGSTYGGYLGLDAAAINDPSSIILDPKTSVIINGDAVIGEHRIIDLPSFNMGAASVTDEYLVVCKQAPSGGGVDASGIQGRISFSRGSSGSYNNSHYIDINIQMSLDSGNVNNLDVTQFELYRDSSNPFFSQLEEIDIDGTKYVALKARSSGGGETNHFYFEGSISDASDTNILSRVRASDSTVTVTDPQPTGFPITPYITKNQDGDIGIGTTSPSANLEVAGAVKVTDSASGVTIGGVGHASLRLNRASTSYDNNILFNTNGDTKFRIWQDGNADYLYIRDDDNATNMVTFMKGGNVGIGTTSPQTKLHVQGGAGIFNVSDDWQQSTYRTHLFRGGGFNSSISEESTAVKIFNGSATDGKSVGNYWGGIGFMHLDPEFGSWGTTYTGEHFWIGGRLIDTPQQERSALVFATNNVTTAGSHSSEKMVILPNGNVGIGATSPIGTLEVQAASSIDGTQLTIANDYGESSKVLAFNNQTDQVGYLSVYGRPSTSGDGPYMSLGLSNGTSVVERLHIAKNGSLDFNAYGAGSFKGNGVYNLGVDSSGNVVETSGIYFGTNTSNTYTNQWHNFLELSYSAYGSVAIKIHLRGHGNTSAQSLVGEIEFNFKNQNGTIRSRATVNSYGTNPISKDEIAIYYDTTNSKINFYWKVKENYTSPQYYIDGYVSDYIWKNTYIGDDTDLASETNDSITANLKFQGITQDQDSGYVGIGTSAPAAELDVDGRGIFRENGNAGGGTIFLDTGNAHASIVSHQNGTSETEGFTLINGVSTASISEVKIGGYLNEHNAATNIAFFTAANNTTRTGSQRMTITGGGNVGIGTTSPDDKLSVIGDAGLYGTVSGGIVSPASLKFFTSENGAGLGDSTDANKQNIGQITWTGKDTSQNATGEYAAIRTYITDSNHLIQGSAGEGGQIEFSTFRHDVSTEARVERVGLKISALGLISIPEYGAGYLKTDANGLISVDSDIIEDTLDSVTDRDNSTTNSIVVGGVGSSGEIALYSTGTADATNTEYHSHPLRFSTSGWDTNNSVARNVHWNIRSESASNIFPDAYLTFYEENISFDHWKLKLPGRGSGSSYIHPDAALFNGNVVLYESDTTDVRIKFVPDGDSYFTNNLGIGTTSPDAPLTVHNSTDPEIRFGYSSSQDHRIVWDSSKVYIHADPENANASSAIGLGVDGTIGLFMDDEHDVGIGTTNPNTRLHVADSTTGIIMRIQNSSAGEESSLRFQALSSTSTQEYADIALDPQSGDGALVFRNPYTSERMRIDGDGNVGIGTNSPAGKLHLEGNFESGKALVIKGTYGTDTTHYIRTHGVNSEALAFYSGTAKPLEIDTSGRIKVNNAFYLPTADGSSGQVMTTDGNGTLTWSNVSGSSSDTLDDVTDNGNSTTNSITVGGVTSTSDNTFKGDTYFENGGDDGAGTRVGNIWYSVSTGGGAAPVGVYESAVITTVQNGTHGRSDLVFKTKDNDTANFGSTVERMRIKKNGNVSIGGVNPQNILHLHTASNTQIQFTTTATGSGSGNGARFGYNGSGSQIWNFENNYVRFATNNVERLRIGNGGYVGIGTTSPATLLHLGKAQNGENRISFGEASYGGPHGLDFYGDDATRTLKYSIYYRTGTENISFETSGSVKRFEINQSGAVTFNDAFTFPTADGSNGAVLVTNGSGALSWNNNYVQYSPIGWYLTTNTTYTTNADNIDSDSTQSAAGNTPVQRNSATEFQATKQGWYEITYNVVVKNNYANRACIGAYLSYAHGQGGGVVQGSHSTEYVRYSTYGEYAQFTNTSYFYAPDAITKFYLRTLLKSGSMNMTTQAQNHNTITFRYINNIIS